MDVETAEAIGGLETRFDRLETRFDSLETRFDGLETRFDRLETRFDGLETRFDRLETRFDGLETRFGQFDARVDLLETSLRREIVDCRTTLSDRIDESQRHSQTLYESLHDDIRLLAEGFAHLSAKIDGLRN